MNISPVLQKTFSRSVLQIQKYSPQILTGLGIAGLVTAGVIAAKQTLKLEETLDASNERLLATKDAVEAGEAAQKDVNKAVARNTVDLVKLYWFPVTLGLGSVVTILVGHRILHQRNLALIGAYTTLEQAFSAYRQRVIEEHGEEADEKYRFGIRDVEETIDGKKVKSQTVDAGVSDYTFIFEPGNENWTGKYEHNLFFLEKFQNIFNDQLRARKHVFLQDVTRALGFEDTKIAAVTGWVEGQSSGDEFINFNIKALPDGRFLLDFNVDGIILDLI